jgi:hypothetical protein
MILRWTVTAVADAEGRFRRKGAEKRRRRFEVTASARDGMAAVVRALKDHENALTAVAHHRVAA